MVGGAIGLYLASSFLWNCFFIGAISSSYYTLAPIAVLIGSEYSDANLNLGQYYSLVAGFAWFTGSILLSLISFISLDSSFLVGTSVIVIITTGLFPLFFLSESPVFLLSNHKVDNLMSTVSSIRKSNQLQDHPQLQIKTETLAKDWVIDQKAQKKPTTP